jgi:hypothetical protein
MKWILFAMVMSPFGQPVDIVDPRAVTSQFSTHAACSELLVEKRYQILEHHPMTPRYLICDKVPEAKVDDAHRYYKQDFANRLEN